MKTKPIGIFDSGIGGLTILQALMKVFNHEKYIYVADRAYFPYGTKTDEEIRSRVLKIGKYLLSCDVKLIIIACNTASLFVESLREITDIPIIGIIEPTVQYAITKTKSNKIACLATNATIKGKRYQNLLEENKILVYPVPCSEFVELIEYGKINSHEMNMLVKEKLRPLLNKGIDTVILGCTHFKLIEKVLKNYLFDVEYIYSSEPIINLIQAKIVLNDTVEQVNGEKCKIYTTGQIEELAASIKILDDFDYPIYQL